LNAIYNQVELDNLRYHSSIYFHGHSVGGTNPSLLEAMACRCRVAAHYNKFNRAVLQYEADYFPDASKVSSIINTPKDLSVSAEWEKINLEKIRTIYNQEKIIDAYEVVMMNACGQTNLVIQPSVAKAV
jgi:hypothetical protein